MGNICRSPTAEGVFRYHAEQAGMLEQLDIDSAGTHAYHTGEPADRRARAAAERRGMSLDGIFARRVSSEDYERFDYIIAMDEDNLARLHDESPEEHRSKLRLFLEFGGGDERAWKKRLEACSRRFPGILPGLSPGPDRPVSVRV
jgi:protein-tyrosine phosphatase